MCFSRPDVDDARNYESAHPEIVQHHQLFRTEEIRFLLTLRNNGRDFCMAFIASDAIMSNGSALIFSRLL